MVKMARHCIIQCTSSPYGFGYGWLEAATWYKFHPTFWPQNHSSGINRKFTTALLQEDQKRNEKCNIFLWQIHDIKEQEEQFMWHAIPVGQFISISVFLYYSSKIFCGSVGEIRSGIVVISWGFAVCSIWYLRVFLIIINMSSFHILPLTAIIYFLPTKGTGNIICVFSI